MGGDGLKERTVTLIKGDGIGPEVADAVVLILEAAGAPLRFEEVVRGWKWERREPQRTVVLVDEIDKAPRDVLNDMLNEMERMLFDIPEIGQRVAALGLFVMSAVIQFVVAQTPQGIANNIGNLEHYAWMVGFLRLATRPPSVLTLDHWLCRRSRQAG